MATPEVVQQVFDIIDNPTQNLTPESLGSVTYQDVVQVVQHYAEAHDQQIKDAPTLVNPDLRPEIQHHAVQQMTLEIQNNYTTKMQTLAHECEEVEGRLVQQIKMHKFPKSNAVIKSDPDPTDRHAIVTVKPDLATRQIGSQEFVLSQTIPLKQITVQMLDNHLANGRVDLVSGLVERVAQNIYQFTAKDRSELSDFVNRYYQQLGIADARRQLKHLQTIKKGVIRPALQGIYYDKLAVALSAQSYRLNNDDWLEARER